jgi:hypothetical protein
MLQFRQSWWTAGQGSVATGGISGRKDAASGAFGGGLQFWYTPYGSATLSTGMALDQNGRVGIGTTSPGYLLELAGISSTSGQTIKSPSFFSNVYTTGAVGNGASTSVAPNTFGNFGGAFLFHIQTTTTGQYYNIGFGYNWNPVLQAVNSLLSSGITVAVSGGNLQITNTSGGTLTFYIKILNLYTGQ